MTEDAKRSAPIGEQTDHVQPVRAGGRRSSRLRIIEPLQLPGDWEALPGVPSSRAQCASGPRPCPYVACRHHLWLRLQEEQPGNPQRGRQGPTTFRPSTNTTCALDVADRGATFDEIGELLGMDSTRARQIAQAALEKLRALGVDVDDMVAAL